MDQLIDEGTDGDSPKPASKGVSNQSTNEGGEAGCSAEVGEGVGGLNQRQIKLLGQVCYHVGMEACACKSVTNFICCMQNTWIHS